MTTTFMEAREQVRGLSSDDRQLLACAIAQEEAERVGKDSPAMFAWNRVIRAIDEAAAQPETKR